MQVAILSRQGDCFPNVISQGLAGMLDELGVKSKIFYDGIPMLMRLLPLNKRPKRWHNNLQFRIRNKVVNYSKDRNLIKKLNNYDAIILSECYPNAFWKNYFAIEELRNLCRGPIISYTDGPLAAAPLHQIRHLDTNDYAESIYDFNLFVTDKIEIRKELNRKQAVIGLNIAQHTGLHPSKKEEFIAVVDFAQPGYDVYRMEQINTLKRLGINTIILEGRYSMKDIRKIYQQASVFFLSFPETFGLPISECLACGAYVFSPDSAWPMAWRLNERLMPMGQGALPDCFQIYTSEAELENKLIKIKKTYDAEKTPLDVFNTFLENYAKFYYGDKDALKYILDQVALQNC